MRRLRDSAAKPSRAGLDSTKIRRFGGSGVYDLAISASYIRRVQNRHFPAVDELIADVSTSAANARNWMGMASALLDVAAHTEANPYAMLDVLEGGIVSTVLLLQPEKRRSAAAAVMTLLLNRFRSNGIG